MKNKLYIFGILASIVCVTGVIFKLAHWPFGGVILSIGIVVFSFVFFPMALLNSYRESKKKGMLYLAILVTVFVNLVAALFKIMHWPGGFFLVVVAMLLPVIFFFPVYLYFHHKEAQESLKSFLSVMFFSVFIATMYVMFGLNNTNEILGDIIKVEELSSKNTAYQEYSRSFVSGKRESKAIQEISKATEQLLGYIDVIKTDKLIKTCENEEVAHQGSVNLWAVCNKEDIPLSERIMLGENNNGEALKLRKQIEEYKQVLLMHVEPLGSEEARLVEGVLNTSDVHVGGNAIPWETSLFKGQMLVSTITLLSHMQTDIQIIESIVLSKLKALPIEEIKSLG